MFKFLGKLILGSVIATVTVIATLFVLTVGLVATAGDDYGSELENQQKNDTEFVYNP